MKLLDDLRSLDRNNIGGWPKSVKTFFTVLLFVVIAFLGWYLVINDQQTNLQNLAGKEEQLKRDFSEKQAKSVNSRSIATAAGRNERHASPAATSVAQQDGNAGVAGGCIANRSVSGSAAGAIPAGHRSAERLLCGKADPAEDDRYLSSVRHIYQWSRIAATRRDPHHARCFPDAVESSWQRRRAQSEPIAGVARHGEDLSLP